MRLGETAAGFGRRVLLLSGSSSLQSSGRLQELLGLLDGLAVTVRACPPGEPSVEGIEDLRRELRGLDPQVIVAVGGGSVLDSAKALAALMPSRAPAQDFLEGIGKGLAVAPPVLPWIAVPTTAGTGSEVTKNAVIKSVEHKVKRSIRSEHLYAACALVDPELTANVPRKLTGMTGMDALTQLIESYVTRRRNRAARALVRDAFPPMLRGLRSLAKDPGDAEARAAVSYGSLVSGIALANSGLGAVHGFASGLGGATEMPHGLICAAFLPAVLRANAAAIEAEIADLMPSKNGTPEELAQVAEELLEAFELRSEIAKYPVNAEDIPEIARRSEGSSMSGNPITLTQEAKERLLRQVL